MPMREKSTFETDEGKKITNLKSNLKLKAELDWSGKPEKVGGNYKRPKSKIAFWGIGVVLSG